MLIDIDINKTCNDSLLYRDSNGKIISIKKEDLLKESDAKIEATIAQLASTISYLNEELEKIKKENKAFKKDIKSILVNFLKTQTVEDIKEESEVITDEEIH